MDLYSPLHSENYGNRNCLERLASEIAHEHGIGLQSILRGKGTNVPVRNEFFYRARVDCDALWAEISHLTGWDRCTAQSGAATHANLHNLPAPRPRVQYAPREGRPIQTTYSPRIGRKPKPKRKKIAASAALDTRSDDRLSVPQTTPTQQSTSGEALSPNKCGLP